MKADCLYEYLRFAIGTSAEVPAFPDEDKLEALVAMAKPQGLCPLLYSALDKSTVPNCSERLKRGKTYGNLIALTWKVEELSSSYTSKVRQLCSSMKQKGMRTCVLKGLSLSAYYEEPSRRQPGDVDLWVEGGREKVLKFLRSRWKITEVVYHHCDAAGFHNPNVEFHFTPSWLFSPFANRRLQRWLNENADAQFSNFNETLGFCIPTVEFNLVYLMVHCNRHLFDEGLKIKQLLDYYYVLKASAPAQRQEAFLTLKQLGLGRFSAACMYALSYAFGMEESLMICPPEERAGKKLLQELDDYIYFVDIWHTGEPFATRVFKRFRHRVGLLRDYPSEVLWAPVFKVWQYVWRWKNGFFDNKDKR